jgi:hypothetical protein
MDRRTHGEDDCPFARASNPHAMSLAAAPLTLMHLQQGKAKKNPARSGIGESYVLADGV